MKIRGLQDEDFVNYKNPSMFIGCCECDWKCCIEQKCDKSMCQNSPLANSKIVDISADEIFRRYINNPITKSIVVGGLEPFLQINEIIELINTFRQNDCLDDFVIYTGYYPGEIIDKISLLSNYPNIVIKYGRFIPNQDKHFDKVLGVYLASDNQFAERIS